MRYLGIFLKLLIFLVIVIHAACTKATQEEYEGINPNFSDHPTTALTIQSEETLIGGPSAQGRVGDVLLDNGLIRVVIQKPSKTAGVGSFGGTIIDADYGINGTDQFGELFPLVNAEWTVNYVDFEVLGDGRHGGPQILRAHGILDAYDFLDLDFTAEVAGSVAGQALHYDDRFDDLKDPFAIHPSLSQMSHEVITDYTLEPGKKYVRIDTTFTNNGTEALEVPVGEFIFGGGALAPFIPGMGFSPDVMVQAQGDTPAFVLAGHPGVNVSYGYFYDLSQFLKNDEESGKKEEKTKSAPQRYTSSSLTFSGVTVMLLGEELLNIMPLGSAGTPEIHFIIPPEASRTITRYFVVGDGSVSSILDVGYDILNVTTTKVSGQVKDNQGRPVADAIVSVKNSGSSPVTAFRTNHEGKFLGLVSQGTDFHGRALGSGKYDFVVHKSGYHLNGTNSSGSCTPTTADVQYQPSLEVHCVLGESATIRLVGSVIDAETQSAIPARMTIVGLDPSPESKTAGTFGDIEAFRKPFGIVDVHLINAKGGFGLESDNSILIEPGVYRIVISHGPEYSLYEKNVEIAPGDEVLLSNVQLKKVISTFGYVGADFHVHALPSPDSWFSEERRALDAVANGLDVLQSSDHDFLTDYAPFVAKLERSGVLPPESIKTIVGDEITPNHFGHLHAFPLEPDFNRPDHGALDWSDSSLDEISPAPDFAMSPLEMIERLKEDPGEEVIQVNHIADNPTGLPTASGWLTSNAYQESHGVKPMVSYADPVERRLLPATGGPTPPFGMDQSELIFDEFTAMELAVGIDELTSPALWKTALPVWFNLLNLGYRITATANSDSHHEIATPLGMPRNYVESTVDPRDGLNAPYFSAIDEEVYAANINRQRVIVSAGPFIKMEAESNNGEKGKVGDQLQGNEVKLIIDVSAPDWAWFDTIDLYANTEPIPADDTGELPMRGAAADPHDFAKPYHVQRYIYDPVYRWRLKDNSLKTWKKENGAITARVEVILRLKEDTWIVALARGTKETPGYRTLFPVVPTALKKGDAKVAEFDPHNLESFHQDKEVSLPAWGFTNPIWIDVDGNGFQAKWSR